MDLDWNQLEHAIRRAGSIRDLWINNDAQQELLSPEERVTVFRGLPESEKESTAKSVLGCVDQCEKFQFIGLHFTLDQAEKITRLIVLNSRPESKLWFDGIPRTSDMPEADAASQTQIVREFKKLTEELQVVIRELSLLTRTEQTWSRILDYTC
ncbi:hypothetical protein FRB94_007541 [Tulasnella sp. JGI-2019a]|nr:hypothetical protein FRB94_007541 [Tulasnella sp. JGI-2019a]